MAVGDDTAPLLLRDEAVSWAPTESGSIVVLDLRTSRYLSLNGAGSVLWPLLAAGAADGALRDALVAEFGISADQAAADVAAFVASLRDRDLLVD